MEEVKEGNVEKVETEKKNVSIRCPICPQTFEGEEEQVKKDYLYHQFTQHYNLFIAKELRKISDDLIQGAMKAI